MSSQLGAPAKDEEEIELERLVFGDDAGFEANLRKIENLYDYSDEEENDFTEFSGPSDSEPEEDLFFIDDGGDASNVHISEGDAMEVDEDAAWVDSDDEKNTVSVMSDRLKKLRHTQEETSVSGSAYVARLRAQFEKIYPRPDWADNWGSKPEDEAEEDPEDALVGANVAGLAAILSLTHKYVKNKTKLLPPTTLQILRLKDANLARRAHGGIQSMNFHPLHPLLLTGGFDRTLRVFHIDGKSNKFVSLVHFRDMPIQTCLFTPGSSLVYAGGRRRYINRWDLDSGDIEKISRMYGQDKFQRSFEYFKVSPKGTCIALMGSSGWVNIVNGTTGQFVRGFKVDGYVADFAFTRDERVLIVANHAGDIWEFAVEGRNTPLRRWTDVGAVTVTKIALGGPGDRWLAIGTKSGVVNLYDRTVDLANPTPFRGVDNLVTQISCLAFSPDGQVLSISSKQKKDALKLVHLPLGTVFANWPTSGTPLGRVTVAEFSPNGQMLAVGNDVGRITLWRLGHY